MRETNGRFKRKINCNDKKFDSINRFSAYFVGLVAADGNLGQKKFAITITQSHNDGYQLLQQIATHIDYSGSFYYIEATDAYTIYINSPKIIKLAEQFNVTPKKSLTYSYPNNLPKELFPYFIRGYFDGDGSLGYYKTNTSKIFIMSMVGTKDFINSCAKLFPISSKVRDLRKENSWEIRWYGKKALQVYKFIYENTQLDITSAKQKKYVGLNMRKLREDKFSKIKDELIKLHKLKTPVAEISKILDSPFQVIYKWMKRAGLKPYTSKNKNVRNSSISP